MTRTSLPRLLATRQHATDAIDVAYLFPTDWPLAFPLARIHTCGCSPLRVEVLQGFQPSSDGQSQPIYGPPDEQLLHIPGMATAPLLLAALVSQQGCFASQDLLSQMLRPTRKRNQQQNEDWEEDWEDDQALRRPDNIVTLLRKLLYPPALRDLPETNQRAIRLALVTRVKASDDSGPGYRLASLPLAWLDVEAMEAHRSRVEILEQFGEDALREWQAVSDIGLRGTFLPYEPYSDWTQWRRRRVHELLWQSVEVQYKRANAWEDRAAGEEEALRLLFTFWQGQMSNEDAFRPLVELLGKRERFQQAEECYQELCRALDQEGRTPHERTEHVMEFVRTLRIQRKESQTPVSAQLDPGLQEQELFFLPTNVEPAKTSIFSYPFSTIPQGNALETAISDCAAKFGIMLAQTMTVVQQWYGMAMFSQELQNQIDQRIRESEASKPFSAFEAYTLSRRNFLIALATLPAATLASRQQAHKISLELEELLPQCAASLIACWHLSKGSFLENIPPIIETYLPALLLVVKHVPSYREIAADLVAQCYFLKAILAWHLEGLAPAETYCIQAMRYNEITKNTNLQLSALNQHALISYYAKDFQKALMRSEKAQKTLLQVSNEHIFPIVQGRVYMYLAAFQAQQSRPDAERTLEQAQKAFARQSATLEAIPLYADCGDASLKLWEGLTHYHLSIQNKAHLQEALASLRTFGSLQPDEKIPERFRLECLTNRTLATLQANDLEETIACFHAGKQGAEALESKQRSAEVACISQEMLKQWPKEERVQQLNTAFESFS